LLARFTGNTPATFSYPFGDCSKAVVRLVKDAGFICACASAERFVRPNANLFAIPRLSVRNEGRRGLERVLGGR
jgi:peptidoglycan/xylan/chitin deacetylase (PgdA/CDA1 family)